MKHGLQTGSMAWRISQLQPGECYVRAERIPSDEPTTAKELTARVTRLADIMRPAVHRARSDAPLANYTTETCVSTTYGGAFIAAVVVTRLPD